MDAASLDNHVQQLHDQVVALEGRCDLVEKRIERHHERRAEFDEQQKVSRKASLLVEQAANEARQSVKARFEGVAGAALRPVFGDDYGFEIAIEEKRNGTFAYCVITNAENHKTIDPLFAKGGSTIDVASIALRLAYLEESAMSGPLVLDEPARMVSAQQIDATAWTIDTLQKMTGRQFILVTHHQKFKEVFPAAVDLDEIYPNESSS